MVVAPTNRYVQFRTDLFKLAPHIAPISRRILHVRRWDKSFFAALTGFCAAQPIPSVIDFDPVCNSEWVANETIRRHAELMTSRDKLIAEVVG